MLKFNKFNFRFFSLFCLKRENNFQVSLLFLLSSSSSPLLVMNVDYLMLLMTIEFENRKKFESRLFVSASFRESNSHCFAFINIFSSKLILFPFFSAFFFQSVMITCNLNSRLSKVDYHHH